MMKMNLGWNEKTKLEKYIFVLEPMNLRFIAVAHNCVKRPRAAMSKG